MTFHSCQCCNPATFRSHFLITSYLSSLLHLSYNCNSLPYLSHLSFRSLSMSFAIFYYHYSFRLSTILLPHSVTFIIILEHLSVAHHTSPCSLSCPFDLLRYLFIISHPSVTWPISRSHHHLYSCPATNAGLLLLLARVGCSLLKFWGHKHLIQLMGKSDAVALLFNGSQAVDS